MKKLMLHVGCGDRKLDGFINIDKEGDPDLKVDVGEGLPFPDSSVDCIFAEHFIEHLTRDEAIWFLRESYRVLKPGGVCRIATPDLENIVEHYYRDTWQEMDWINRFHYEWIPNRCVMLNTSMREWGHKNVYDFEDLRMIGNIAGFLLWKKRELGESDFLELRGLEYRPDSFVIEFLKEDEIHRDELPLVSICIPAYKHRFFEEAILSALAQSYLNLEIVVCDDSSDNRIQEIIESLDNGRIRYFKNSERLDSWRNTLKAISLAHGKYIKILNDDDLLHPDCVKAMVSYMEAYGKRVSLVTSKRDVIDGNGNKLSDLPGTRLLSACDSYLKGIDLGNFVIANCVNCIGEPSAVMFRKEDASGFDELFKYFYGGHLGIGDVVMWLSLLRKGDAIYIGKPLSFFRWHSDQEQKDSSKIFFWVRSWSDLVRRSVGLGYLKNRLTYRRALINLINSLQGWLKSFHFNEKEKSVLAKDIEEIKKELLLCESDVGPPLTLLLYPVIRDEVIRDKVPPSPEIQYSAIQTLIRKGFIEEAIMALQVFVEQHPDFTMALNDLGVLYFLKGKIDLAVATLEECIDRDPSNQLAVENLRDIYERLRDKGKNKSQTWGG